MREEFATRDHSVLVGRKRSVDWALLPALLIAEIAQGMPPESWSAQLDDAYGAARPIRTASAAMPNGVARWCRALERADSVAVSFITQASFGTLSEFPAAIRWEAVTTKSKGWLRSNWFEPALGLRGVDFPLLPDRIAVNWNDSGFTVSDIATGLALSAEWPYEPPSFTHLADEYDIGAALRAWHWAQHAPERASFAPPIVREHPRTERAIKWRAISAHQWLCEITLREAAARRSAGFQVKGADGLVSESVDAPVEIVPHGSTVELYFVEPDESTPDDQLLDGRFGLHAIVGRVKERVISRADYDWILDARDSEELWRADAAVRPVWADAMLRIAECQSGPARAAASSLSQPGMVRGHSIEDGIVHCADAWVCAAQGDLAGLEHALRATDASRRSVALSHFDILALVLFAESIALRDFPAESIHLVLRRVRALCGERGHTELWWACDASTASGRFWAACEIARGGLEHAKCASEVAAWIEALAILSPYLESPDAGVSSYCDDAVLWFGRYFATGEKAEWSPDSLMQPTDIEGGLHGAAAQVPLARLRAIPRTTY